MKKSFKLKDVMTISFSHLAHDIYSSFLAPMLPLLIDKVGLSLSEAGFLDIARRLPALFNPLFGLMAERSEAKYLVVLAPSITAISMGLVGLTNSYVLLLLLLFVAGLSAALYHIPAPVMIKEVSGDKTGRGMSFFMVGGESARTIGPLIITAAITHWGLEGSYRLVPFGILASFLLYLRVKNFEFHKDFSKKREKGDVKEFFRKYSGFFTLIGGFILFQSMMKSALVLYMPVFLVQKGATLWEAGISLSVLQFFGILGTMFSGSYSDKIGRVNMLYISTAISAIFMFLFVEYGSIFLFPILSILGFFLFASGPVLMAGVQDLGSNMPTFANSMYMTVNFGVSSVAVYSLGVLGDTQGLDFMYKVALVCSFICLVFIYFLGKKQ